jgi:peptidoglycan/xylan/chitin deacetylase (PgdA/CDA1 family)
MGCFSFDDGPSAQGDITARLLDVLKRHRVRALFCLLGENAERRPDLVRRIYEESHVIANHGYSDKWACWMSGEEFLGNLIRGEAAISAALGNAPRPKLYRPHGGFYRKKLEEIALGAGYTLVPADVRVYDAATAGKDRAKVTEKVIGKVIGRGGG